MIKKKTFQLGFTLIELLGIIIVLAAIALVTVPIVMNTVESFRGNSIKNSAYGYIKALEYYVVSARLHDEAINGTFDYQTHKANIQTKGVQPTNVDLTIANGKILNGSMIFDNYVVMISGGEVLEVVKGRDAIYSKSMKIYGVAFNGTTGTRTDSATGLTFTVNASTITSSFDNAEIYKEITEVTDTYGNVFVKIPRFYISKSKAGANFTYKISKTKQDSTYYIPYSFYDETTNMALSYVLIGKYNASLNGTKLESKSGSIPLVSQTIATFRTYAKNNNVGMVQGYQLLDIHAIDIIQTLFYVEFATLNSQSIMQGYTAASNTSALLSGTTDSVVTTSGSPTSNTDGKYTMKYRGIENMYGNIYQFIDGINIQNNQTYIATNPSSYVSDTFTGAYKTIGYVNKNTNGYVTEMGYDSANPAIQLPTVTGTNTYGDYYYQTTSNNIALFGCYWNRGGCAGLSSWHLAYSSGGPNLSIGSRSLKKAL